ncbi:phage tail tube protein [Clostridium neuense]|uniref:Phage tail tube protein n=1 Tax=Clostridium neuense TaxID=1728934 RepID=A0ABW8TG60_9CLOT|nr:phage tail tube protein [Clostridium sp. DMHC 10]KOF56814.1 hypothetical protein AGR56_09120 [Clostridium sp. DMHC 10]
MDVNSNRVLSGSDGKVWVNGELWAEIQKIEFKITGNFDSVNFVGDPKEHSRYTGCSSEGTITLNKTYSRGVKMISDAFKSGVFPDITILTKVTDKQTNQSERWELKEVLFTELGHTIEAKKTITQEMPFKFGDWDILETISA